MPTEVIAEGDTDRATVRAILPSVGLPMPETNEGGRIYAIHRAAAACRLMDRRVVLLLDRNGFTANQIDDEVQRALAERWGHQPARKGAWWVLGSSALRLVLAGLPVDPTLRELGIARYTADDYLLKLLLDDGALEAFCQGENNLSWRPANAIHLREAMERVRSALDAEGIPLDSSKRYVHVARASLGFEPSRAKLAEHLITRAPAAAVATVLGTLRTEIATDPALEP